MNADYASMENLHQNNVSTENGSIAFSLSTKKRLLISSIQELTLWSLTEKFVAICLCSS